eukprot:353668-Chlamydomonas_euryale.AAC.2
MVCASKGTDQAGACADRLRVPYLAVPARLSVAGCHCVPAGTCRTMAHPPPSTLSHGHGGSGAVGPVAHLYDTRIVQYGRIDEDGALLPAEAQVLKLDCDGTRGFGPGSTPAPAATARCVCKVAVEHVPEGSDGLAAAACQEECVAVTRERLGVAFTQVERSACQGCHKRSRYRVFEIAAWVALNRN